MFETEDLKIWNLTPGIDTFTGPQEIFNIVGNLNFPEKLREFNYSLNNRPEKQVFFKSSENGSARLEKPLGINVFVKQGMWRSRRSPPLSSRKRAG